MSEQQSQPTEAASAVPNLPDSAPQIQGEIPAGAIPTEPASQEAAPATDGQQAAASEPNDVVMTDGPAEQAPPPAPASTAAVPSSAPTTAPAPAAQSSAPSPVPVRTSTPGVTMPSEAPVHGAPVRQYLNTKVTGALLEGMKIVAKEQPKDPLRVLGEFLIQRSRDLEPST
ncbi:hypothetical protein OQA88_5690 [Cercophora sp. LCS_1]